MREQCFTWLPHLDNHALCEASGSTDFSAKLWDALIGDELHSFAHKHIVRACDFPERTSLLLTGGHEKILSYFLLELPHPPPAN
jgi:serine-threonine kinase receptor-associated protein